MGTTSPTLGLYIFLFLFVYLYVYIKHMCGGIATEVDTTMFSSITFHLIMSLQAPFVMSGFYVGTGDPNQEFITASTGPAEPSPNPSTSFTGGITHPVILGRQWLNSQQLWAWGRAWGCGAIPDRLQIPGCHSPKQLRPGTELTLHLWEQLNACALNLSLAQLGWFFSATKHAKRRTMFAISWHLLRVVVAILDRRSIVSSLSAPGCRVTSDVGVAKSDPWWLPSLFAVR